MNTVHPLKKKKQINDMKKALGNPRDKMLFIFGINTGLRISDILKLKVRDVRNKVSLTLQETKTSKSKIVYFNDNVKEAVKTLMPSDANDDDYVFKSRKGNNKPLTRVQAYNILNGAAERVGIDQPIGCHTLRKTFGYWQYKNNNDISLLMAIFNHSSASVTLKYIGITEDNIMASYKGVNL
ncbi:tyrosine-type recombinase/integrase [Alkalihalobacillus macyae]|uniref:tyrosine-type recombinase/integrase n=1 Tax=Guptibacillus hwajinpoensis TaxID=208199 RepID=UPI00273CB233|nr:tyrosine-type recombinase/integrase [Alkalihalobacillus macyae]MDP4549836.1 tyrosine-type recombinase/integrase [Alkalihalobacillus macyae]